MHIIFLAEHSIEMANNLTVWAVSVLLVSWSVFVSTDDSNCL